jgi:hypothetical protein
VGLPALPGVTAGYENTLGEFDTRLFLAEHLRDTAAAAPAAAGRDGERYRVQRAAAGDAIVWVTVWDTPAEGEEFLGALTAAAARRYRVPASQLAAGSATVAGRLVTLRSGVVSGRPAVLWTDAPAAAAPIRAELAGVTLQQE